MAEWFKATDLKSVVGLRPPGVRIPLTPPRGDAREADWARLLSECGGEYLRRGFESHSPRLIFYRSTNPTRLRGFCVLMD